MYDSKLSYNENDFTLTKEELTEIQENAKKINHENKDYSSVCINYNSFNDINMLEFDKKDREIAGNEGEPPILKLMMKNINLKN